MQSSKILLKDGQTVNLVDSRINAGDIETWNNKLDNTGDASNTTASFTKNSGDTSSVTSGSKLSAIFTSISSFFASLKALAFKDKVSDSDINGTISDSHIASASTWNGKYTKPSTGIPKGDLDSAVQNSLDKADTALQSHQDISGKADKSNITGATKCKITYNSQGIVTAGNDLSSSDIPNLAASKITSGTFGTDRIADDAITAAKVKANETLPVNISGKAGSATVADSAQSAYSAKTVDATVDNSITSTGTNGSMTILNGGLSSSGGGGGSCSIDGDGISFTKGVGGSSMTADSISTAGTGTFTAGANAKGRSIDGSATILTNKSSITWNSEITNLVVNRSAGLTTTIDLKNLLNGVVYWLHVPRDNIIALKNSSVLSTFYCYDESFTVNRTTDTYDIRSHIRGSSHGGFSCAIVRSNNNFYVMMDY